MHRVSRKRIERAAAEADAWAISRQLPVCPLCQRPILPGTKQSRHHLTPRLRGGTNMGTVLLHQICHSAIHARFSETELARRLADVEALRTHPALTDFIAWVKTKPPAFHAPTRMTRIERERHRDKNR
jgi:5-methylcytosine-specific restriction enzyme A